MLKLSKKTPPAVGSVIVDMSEGLKSLYDSRNIMISGMSGYPSAIHAIGRLQRLIKTTSYAELLTSLIKVRDIARVTADVIDSMEGVKTDRYQINRTEIIAYVDNVTSTVNSIVLTDEDKDLIANIITSFEANSGSWILNSSDDDTNLHVRMRKLYKHVTRDVSSGALHVYNPHSDSISQLSELPNFSTSKGRAKVSATQAADAKSKLEAAQTYYQYAAVRLIDHVYSLLMDHNIWYSFVSPRTKAEVSANLERSKSLKVLSLYVQSLLSYNQFFMFEVFMKTYQTLQDWISVFPPLSATTRYSMDNVIRPHDLLGAQKDVDAMFSSLSASADSTLAVKTIVFPRQSLAAYGLQTTYDALVTKAASLKVSAPFTDLSALDDRKYLPILSGIAMSSLNMTHDVTKVVLLDKIVAEEVKLALADLVPSLVRGSSELTISTLEDLALRPSIPFDVPRALSFDVSKGAEHHVINGKIWMDSGSPRFCWDYHKKVRDDYSYKVVDQETLMGAYSDQASGVMFNRDRAGDLRELFGLSWKSYVPSCLATGPTLMTAAQLKADEHAVRNMIETLTGSHYDIVIRELGVEHLRKLWATYLSSFAILYYNESDTKASATNMPTMVEGWGRPYGKTYEALSATQGASVDFSDLIPIGAGGYIRILKKVPKVKDELTYIKDYYMAHPAFYYASNSDVMVDFQGWILDDSLLHLAMVPVCTDNTIPTVVLSNKFAYMTNSIYINTDIYYKPDAPSASREVFSIPAEKKNWPFERFSFYLDYIGFGPYGNVGSNALVDADETEKIADALKKIENQMDEDNKEQTADKSKVDSTSPSLEDTMETEVTESNKKKETPKDDEPPHI